MKISGPFGAANINSHALWGRAKRLKEPGVFYGGQQAARLRRASSDGEEGQVREGSGEWRPDRGASGIATL